MPLRNRAGKHRVGSSPDQAEPMVRHWLRRQLFERASTFSQVRELNELLAGLPAQREGSAGVDDSRAILQKLRRDTERLLGRLSPRSAPLVVTDSLVQYVTAWRDAHPQSMSHLSIAEELSELSLAYGCLLIDGLELFLEGLVSGGGVPRFSLVVLLDRNSHVKMTLCSFGQPIDFDQGAELALDTLALQVRSVGGQLTHLRNASLGSVLQLLLPA